MKSHLFSIGGTVSRFCSVGPAWAPGAFAALILSVGAFWDPLVRSGRVDFILLGLAGYELVLALTEEERSGRAATSGADTSNGT